MCSNFEPASPKQIESILNKQLEIDFNYKKRVYPKDYCPIIIQTDKGLSVVKGQFGLTPSWASAPVDYSTHNARIETIEDKKTFKPAFTRNQFCLVPMQGFMSLKDNTFFKLACCSFLDYTSHKTVKHFKTSALT